MKVLDEPVAVGTLPSPVEVSLDATPVVPLGLPKTLTMFEWSQTIEYNTPIVMQPAPAGQRGRTRDGRRRMSDSKQEALWMADALERALALLDVSGWCKHHVMDAATGEVCAVGALLGASTGLFEASPAAMEKIGPLLRYMEADTRAPLASWNDDPRTTLDDVRHLFASSASQLREWATPPAERTRARHLRPWRVGARP